MSDKFIDKNKLNALLYNNPEFATVISKTITRNKSNKSYNVRDYAIKRQSEYASNEMVNSEFGRMFYDLEIAVDILIGLILSPKGNVRPELIYSVSSNQVPNSISTSIISDISDYLNKEYRLSSNLANVLKQVFYTKGSSVKLIIPESEIDVIIKKNLELSKESLSSLTTSKGIPLKGILSNGTKEPSMDIESILTYSNNTTQYSPTLDPFNIVITDNTEVLKEPMLREYITKENVYSTDYDALHKRNKGTLDLGSLKPERKSIGKPLYLDIDPGCIIPVHVPGNPKQHISYLVPLDEKGYIISKKSSKEIKAYLENNKPTKQGKSIIDHARRNLKGFSNSEEDSARMLSLFMNQIESTIRNMATTGAYKCDLEFSSITGIYAAMLARAFEGLKTRLLFVPAERVSYYAFKFNKSGMGVTLLDDLPTLSRMRSSLLFSGLVSEVRNNIPQTRVNVSLDDSDTDPEKTLEMIIGTALENQAQYIPTDPIHITDWVDWAQRAGFSFQVDEHPMLPNTKITYEDNTPNRSIPSNSEFMDKLRAQQMMAIGVTPEMVDNGFNSDFASTDAGKRIQLARRVTAYQMSLADMITDEVRKIARADGTIVNMVYDSIRSIDKLKDYLPDNLRSNYKSNSSEVIDYLVNEVVSNIRVDLVSPDTNNLELMERNLDTYIGMLDTALDAWINEDFIGNTNNSEILRDNVTEIRAALRAYYIRSYMSKNGYMSELARMVGVDKEGNAAIDLKEEMSAHISGLISTAEAYIEMLDRKNPPKDNTTDDNIVDPTLNF